MEKRNADWNDIKKRKIEFDAYLYIEKELTKAKESLYIAGTGCSDEWGKREKICDLLDKKRTEFVDITTSAYKITEEKFYMDLEKYENN